MTRSLIRRLWAPLVTFLLFFVLTLAIDDLMSRLSTEPIGQRILFYAINIGIWLSSAYFVNRLVILFLWDRLVAKAIRGPVPRLLKQVFALFIYTIAVTGIIGIVFKRSITGFWATSGVVGLILGFALRNIILDVFTGLAVNIERPYKIGDWVTVHGQRREQNVTGRITEINWRTTRIRTEENTTVIIPNGLLSTMIVTNFWSPNLESRFETTFCLDFSVPTERAHRVLLAGVKAGLGQEGLLRHPEPEVLVGSTTPLGVEYTIRYWIIPWEDTTPSVASDRITTSVLEHLQQAGITLAYPKQDIFYDKMPTRHLDARSMEDRKLLLAKIELFEHLDDEEREIVATKMRRQFCQAEEILVKRGDKGESMFILLEGLLYVFLDIRDSGEETKVAQIVPGQFFGEMSLLTGEPRSATIKATTDTVVYEIRKDTMNALFENRPQTAEMISNVVAERRLRNLQVQEEVPLEEKVVQTETLARQIMSRIKLFFKGIFEKQVTA